MVRRLNIMINFYLLIYLIYLFICLLFSYHTYAVLTVLLSKLLRTSLILSRSRVKKYGELLQATHNYKFSLVRVFCIENILRWCYTRRLATTIFSATQRCNIVATLFRIGTTLFQLCNASWLCYAKNRRFESSSITSPLQNFTLQLLHFIMQRKSPLLMLFQIWFLKNRKEIIRN